MLEKELYSLMSSANNLTEVEVCKLSTISLMKRMNKSGPRTLPCGTPLVILCLLMGDLDQNDFEDAFNRFSL